MGVESYQIMNGDKVLYEITWLVEIRSDEVESILEWKEQ